MNTSKKKFAFVILLMTLVAVGPVQAQTGAPSGNGQSLPEVIEAIEKARVTTRILYVTAHPDDEPGAVLSYLARGLHADVALLSLTRGEGGQNALGPEQAPQLGVLRTEELMNATRVYGTRLFFTRAADFGYTKTADEALKVWGDQTLEDIVRVIRTFRPHVIINNWGGVRGGHGQHVASGLLTPQAYAMAADAKAFPKLMEEGLQPWKADALLQLSRGNAPAEGFSIPVSEISPLWGKNWGEIGVEGYLNHRTQGVGGVRSSPFFRRPITLVAVEGAKPDAALLAATLDSFVSRFPAFESAFRSDLEKSSAALRRAEETARNLDWAATVKELAEAGRPFFGTRAVVTVGNRMEELANGASEIRQITQHIRAALTMAAGVRIDAQAERSEVVTGESFTVTVNWLKRNDVPVEIEGASLALPEGWSVTKEEKQPTGGVRFTVAIPKDAKANAANGEWIYPSPGALVKARLKAKVEEYVFETETEVTATRVTSVSAETRPLMLVPAVTLTVVPKAFVLVQSKPPKEVSLVIRVRHYSTAKEKVTVGVDVPAEWGSGVAQTVECDGPGDQFVWFHLIRPAQFKAGHSAFRAYAKRDSGEEFRSSLEPLPTLPTRSWSEPSEARVHIVDVNAPQDLRVGYIAAENDPIPEALKQIGIHVEMLDEFALSWRRLADFDAVCVGIRAYELRSDLARANQRLLDYAAAGGTLVVQYQREGVWNQLKPAPYPATIGNGLRTTDENSPVRILEPLHPLLNFPNAIRIEDYSGWVQERGLYYWGTFDAKYTPVLAMKDPGEQEALGALVYAKHGKGVYIYTGLSFFRQLPEGVPGAYRLFVNLLSQGMKK